MMNCFAWLWFMLYDWNTVILPPCSFYSLIEARTRSKQCFKIVNLILMTLLLSSNFVLFAGTSSYTYDSNMSCFFCEKTSHCQCKCFTLQYVRESYESSKWKGKKKTISPIVLWFPLLPCCLCYCQLCLHYSLQLWGHHSMCRKCKSLSSDLSAPLFLL